MSHHHAWCNLRLETHTSLLYHVHLYQVRLASHPPHHIPMVSTTCFVVLYPMLVHSLTCVCCVWCDCHVRQCVWLRKRKTCVSCTPHELVCVRFVPFCLSCDGGWFCFLSLDCRDCARICMCGWAVDVICHNENCAPFLIPSAMPFCRRKPVPGIRPQKKPKNNKKKILLLC